MMDNINFENEREETSSAGYPDETTQVGSGLTPGEPDMPQEAFLQGGGLDEIDSQHHSMQSPGVSTYTHPQYTSQQSKNNADNSGYQIARPAEIGSYQWNYADYHTADPKKSAPPKRKKGLLVFSVALLGTLVISGAAIAGVGIVGMRANEQPPSSQSGQAPAMNGDTDKPAPGITLRDKPQVEEDPLPDGKLSTEDIVERVQPSVVAISTYISQGYMPEGVGSGIIIREDGYIVTNAHVVEGARGITVTMSDGEQKYEGRVVGSDSKTDIAVIKIEAEGLSAAMFGNSDQTRVGEKVIAIGNPQSLDFAGSVTQGIVSGLNRSLTAGGSNGTSVTNYTSLIQTDAAINPGNSGGALVNEYGQVIGINSAKVISTGAEGMGFAIPSATVQPIVAELIKNGRVTGRVLLGVTVMHIDQVQARLNGVPIGLYIQTTSPNSDISRKGVVPGDIITKINDLEITTQQVLVKELEDKKPGESVRLEIYRPGSTRSQNGAFFEIDVILMEDTGESLGAVEPLPGVEVPTPNGGSDGFGDFYIP